MSNSKEGNSVRSREIDALRGVAVILVLGRHFLHIPDSLSPAPGLFFLVWARIGWIGVDLFFVLSGFLVAGLLFVEQQKTGRVRVARFLIRRAFKIYPPFYSFLIVSFLTSWTADLPVPTELRYFLSETFFLQNYLDPLWNHTWSLAVEEHFYLLLAALIAALHWRSSGNPNPFRSLPIIIGFSVLTLLVIRVTFAYSLPGNSDSLPVNAWMLLGFPTHFRIDSLLFGVLLAYYFHYHRDGLTQHVNRFPLLLLLNSSLMLLLPLFLRLEESRFLNSFGYSLLYLSFGSVVLLSLLFRFAKKERVLQALRIPIQIGERSYSIYLWHMMVYHLTFRFCTPATPAAFYLQSLLYLTGSLIFGFFFARAIEFPMLLLRDHYFPSDSQRVVPSR